MAKIDEVISDVAYVLDSLILVRDIYNSGTCNDCKVKRTCEYCPEPGKLVRYNCPFYERKKE